jgi:hypothetical protein
LSETHAGPHSYDPLEDLRNSTYEGDVLGVVEQLVTVAAVLLGSLATYWTNEAQEKRRNQHELLTRWDDKKLSA